MPPKKKSSTETASSSREVFYIRKVGMARYQLRKLTIDSDVVEKDEVIKDDIPNIVVQYLLLSIQNGKFNADPS